jgi:hypothetical protein
MFRQAHFIPGLDIRGEGKYKVEGRFIALSVEPVVPAEALQPLPVFTSISSGIRP